MSYALILMSGYTGQTPVTLVGYETLEDAEAAGDMATAFEPAAHYQPVFIRYSAIPGPGGEELMRSQGSLHASNRLGRGLASPGPNQEALPLIPCRSWLLAHVYGPLRRRKRYEDETLQSSSRRRDLPAFLLAGDRTFLPSRRARHRPKNSRLDSSLVLRLE